MERSAPLIGIDLVDPSELAARLEHNPELREELFHPGEISYAEAQPRPHEHLAARYAAKEAVIKALGIDGWDPLDVEILGGGESLEIQLHKEVAARARELGVEVRVSLSHLAQLAAAVALARPRSP